MGHFGRLYTALRNQSAFKPHEIRPYIDVPGESGQRKFNGFFIAPKRDGADPEELQVAGGAFGAFSGFVHQSYREFDYVLGLRNCQRFVDKHFELGGNTVLDLDVGNEITQLLWPNISERDFKKIAKPMNVRTRKVVSILSGSKIVGFLVRKLASKKIKEVLCEHQLIDE